MRRCRTLGPIAGITTFGKTEPMNEIGPTLLDQLPLEQIEAVIFYKRDELTTDLICCDVRIAGKTWFFHEEMKGWDLLIKHFAQLPGFRSDWYAAVAHPPFARNTTVAFLRPLH